MAAFRRLTNRLIATWYSPWRWAILLVALPTALSLLELGLLILLILRPGLADRAGWRPAQTLINLLDRLIL